MIRLPAAAPLLLRPSSRLALVGVIAALIGVVIGGDGGGRSAPPEDTSSSHNEHG
ncbi:hypothetical protein [Streptomyces sp. NPDC096105]|uniref:hypothetical protein n=1 Tax=Streptomyces sp. NPDC096105 TaxID=3366074 RepID=UPI003805639C